MNAYRIALVLLLSHFAAFAQSSNLPDHLDSLMVRCFSQANLQSHEYAGNCASISVIKLAMRRYGRENVLLHVDSLETGYDVQLRDGTRFTLSKAELASMAGLDKFVPGTDPRFCKSARFIYAVMAKNRLLMLDPIWYSTAKCKLDNINWQPSSANSAKYKTVRDVACDMSTGRHPACQFELITDTKANFCLLGLSGEVVTTTINPKQFATTTSGVIVTSERHSAYCGKGFYDEYGTMLSISEFRSQHCIAFSCLLPNRDIQTVYSLK